MIFDRKSQKLFEEKIYFGGWLRFLYARNPFSRFLRTLIAKNTLFSRLCGWWQRLPWTRFQVAPFIRKYGIDATEFAEREFPSFDAFFTRKLREGARPIEGEVCMPADGRYLVYPNVAHADGFLVKGERFSLSSLLCDASLAAAYSEGSLVLARLAPVDYHRFHFPIDNRAGCAQLITGSLYSVHPLAMRQNIHRFTQNKRMITPLESTLGHVLCIEVGATNVGSIHQTYRAGESYRRGDEKGFFSFGGSALILLFPPNRVEFDPLLIRNSAHYLETRCLMGQILGRRL